MAAVLAVDIGGTKVRAGIVDGAGAVVLDRTVATPQEVDPEILWEAVAGAVDWVTQRAAVDLEACGVGCGGPMAAGGEEVSPLNIPGWRAFPLRARLADHTGLAVTVDNDAKALALGEGWRGAARGERHFLAMVVSTGVGGGIVLDGRLLDGGDGNAGHIGHVVVEPEGRVCGCGARGCLEAEASGTAVAALTGAPPADAPPAMRRRVGTLVGRAVASVANLLDLRLAVVAGSVALGYGEVLFAAARDEASRVARLEFSSGVQVVPAGLGADGPLVGAAGVAWRSVAWRGVDHPPQIT